MVITIDGPVAAGKTSAASGLAARIGFPLLDTGAIYRCVALGAQIKGLNWHDEATVAQVANELDIEFRTESGAARVLLSSTDVTEEIRRPEISQGASIVSALPGVRAALLSLQRQQAARNDLIAEGRDTGTVVFPQADCKFFLTAAPSVRSRRRFLELHRQGIETDLDDVLAELEERDHRDSTRSVAPLVAAPDALTINSSAMSATEVVDELERLVSRDLGIAEP